MAIGLSGITGFQHGVDAYKQAANRVVDKLIDQPQVRSVSNNSQESGSGFDGVLGAVFDRAVRSTRDTISRGEILGNQAIMGKAQLNEVVTAVSQAEISLQTVMALRDRVISAYQEILKMPI